MVRDAWQTTEKSDSSTHEAASSWVIFTEIHPLPTFGLDSPVVDHLLASWTPDTAKSQFLVSWIQCLACELPNNFPKGVQAVELTPTIRDGFLMLLLPIISSISVYPIKAYTRESRKQQQGAIQASNTQDDLSFAEIYAEQFMTTTELFDIRLKVFPGEKCDISQHIQQRFFML